MEVLDAQSEVDGVPALEHIVAYRAHDTGPCHRGTIDENNVPKVGTAPTHAFSRVCRQRGAHNFSTRMGGTDVPFTVEEGWDALIPLIQQ